MNTIMYVKWTDRVMEVNPADECIFEHLVANLSYAHAIDVKSYREEFNERLITLGLIHNITIIIESTIIG